MRKKVRPWETSKYKEWEQKFKESGLLTDIPLKKSVSMDIFNFKICCYCIRVENAKNKIEKIYHQNLFHFPLKKRAALKILNKRFNKELAKKILEGAVIVIKEFRNVRAKEEGENILREAAISYLDDIFSGTTVKEFTKIKRLEKIAGILILLGIPSAICFRTVKGKYRPAFSKDRILSQYHQIPRDEYQWRKEKGCEKLGECYLYSQCNYYEILNNWLKTPDYVSPCRWVDFIEKYGIGGTLKIIQSQNPNNNSSKTPPCKGYSDDCLQKEKRTSCDKEIQNVRKVLERFDKKDISETIVDASRSGWFEWKNPPPRNIIVEKKELRPVDYYKEKLSRQLVNTPIDYLNITSILKGFRDKKGEKFPVWKCSRCKYESGFLKVNLQNCPQCGNSLTYIPLTIYDFLHDYFSKKKN